jgi:very-short-patch-repair endonuclease
LATAPAWTAVEVARTLRRSRALAILDAALHVGACSTAELDSAVREQKGRRGIVDHHGERWRVDFAWPDAKVAAEYDSVEWHANPEGFKHDRLKTARLQECGWTTISAVVDDIRRRPEELVRRVFWHLDGAALAG